jgi:hypothetical protein
MTLTNAHLAIKNEKTFMIWTQNHLWVFIMSFLFIPQNLKDEDLLRQ